MRRVIVVMFMTLDGVAEFPDYPDEYTPSGVAEEQAMWSPRMDSMDTLFLGRRAYEGWSQYWGARLHDTEAGTFGNEFAKFCDRADKVVFSKTMKEANWKNSRIVRGDIATEVARLRALPGKDMAVGGGPRLAQSFFEHDLADELLLEVFPSLVGRGKPLFQVAPDPDHGEDVVPQGAPGRHDFRLIETRPLRGGTVLLHYARAGAGQPPKT